MKNTIYLNIYKAIWDDNLLKKIIKNSGVVFFGNSGASALSFISFSIMAKQLGAELLAILVLAQTYSMIVNDIFNVQTWESLVKFGSAQKDNLKIVKVIRSNLALDIISAVVATIFAIILVLPVSHVFHWDSKCIDVILIYSISILFKITTLTIAIPRIFNKFTFVAKIQVVFAFVKLSFVIFAAYMHKDYYYYYLIYLTIEILTQLSLIVFSIRLISSLDEKWWRGSIQFDKEQMKFIWWTNLRTIIRIPVRRLDIMLINLIISFKMIGIYKVYKEIAGILDRLSDPINQVIFPEFAALIGEKQIAKSKKIAKKTIGLLFVISLFLTILLLFLAKPIIIFFFGVEYLTHIFALYTLIFFNWLVFFTTPINSLFIAAGFAKYSFYIVIFSNTIFLICAYVLGSLAGIYGIIIALILQGIINQGLKIYLMKRHSSGWDAIIR